MNVDMLWPPNYANTAELMLKYFRQLIIQLISTDIFVAVYTIFPKISIKTKDAKTCT